MGSQRFEVFICAMNTNTWVKSLKDQIHLSKGFLFSFLLMGRKQYFLVNSIIIQPVRAWLFSYSQVYLVSMADSNPFQLTVLNKFQKLVCLKTKQLYINGCMFGKG